MITRKYAALAVLALLASCKNDKGGDDESLAHPTEAEVVTMYGHYIERNYNLYVDQMESLDGKTEDYRQQMMAAMKQLRHRQDSLHGGPVSCRVMRFEPASNGQYCNAFVEITFKDRSYEQVLVPLVRKDDVWRLK